MSEVGSVTIKITGDASGLEAAISSASAMLSSLGKTGVNASSSTQKAIEAASKSTATYSDIVAGAKSNLDSKNRVLKQTRTEYENTRKTVKESIAVLTEEQKSIQGNIAEREKAIENYRKANSELGKNSKERKSNNAQIKKEQEELKKLYADNSRVTSQLAEQNNTLSESRKSYDKAASDAKKAGTEYNKLARNLEEVSRYEKAFKLQETGQNVRAFGETVDTFTKPVQYAATALAAGAVASTKFAIDFESAFAGVTKTVDGTPEQLETLRQGIIDLSTTGINGRNAIGMTTSELSDLAAMGGQLGIQTDNLLEFTEVMAQLGTATNIQGETGAAELARFMNVMGESQGNIRNVSSAIVDLGNNSATTEAEILQMAQRMGGYSASVGISTQDTLGYSAALSSLGVEAEAGGSAVGRTWMGISTAVSEGGDTLKAFAKISGKTSEEFANQWKTDASGTFLDVLQGLHDSDDIVKSLSDLGINNTLDIQAMMKLANGIDLVKSSLQRSNSAYAENTALQNEFDTRAETTGEQLKVTRNNLMEAGRSLGESFLPIVQDGSAKVKEFAQNIANMSDENKRTLINVGTGVVAFGALSKGISAGTEAVGGFIEGYGKIAEFAPAIAKAIPTAGVAALGIAAIAGGAKLAYDSWYKSNFRWSDDFAESSREFEEAADKYTQLSDLRNQYTQAKQVLQNPSASTEDIEAAKAKIEEIKALLEQDYNLTITSDTTDLDNTFNSLTAQQRYETMQAGSSALSEMEDAAKKYKESEGDLEDYNSQLSELQSKARTLGELKAEAVKLAQAHESGSIGLDEYNKRLGELKEKATDAGASGAGMAESTDVLIDELKNTEEMVNGQMSSLSDTYRDVRESRELFKASMESATESYAQMLAGDVQIGDQDNIGYDVVKMNEIGRAAKEAGISTNSLATSFAAARAGYTDFDQAVADGHAGEMSQSFIQFKKDIGDFAGAEKEVVAQAALIKNGFSEVTPELQNNNTAIANVLKDVQQLGAAEGLNLDAAQLTDIAKSLDLLPDSKTIQISADGDISVVEDIAAKVEELNGKNAEVTLSVNDDGSVSVIDTTNQKLQELMQNGDVTLKYNVETSGFDILDGEEKVGTITAEGKIEWVETEPPDVPDATQTVNQEQGETVPTEAEPATQTVNQEQGETVPTEAEPATQTVNQQVGEQVSTQAPDLPGTVKYTGNFDSVGTAPELPGTVAYTGDFSGIGDPPALTGTVTYTAVYTQNATGSTFHPGGLAVVNDQKGVADPRELIVDKGRAFIPEGRDVMVALSRGAKVYTAAQTKNIMSSLGIPHYAGGVGNGSYRDVPADVSSEVPDGWLDDIIKKAKIRSGIQKETNELVSKEAGIQSDIASYLREQEALAEENSDEFKKISELASHYLNTHAVSTADQLKMWVDLSAEFSENTKDAAAIEEQIYKLMVQQNSELNEISNKYIELHSFLNNWSDINDDPLSAFERVRERNYNEYLEGRMTWDDYTETMTDFGDDMLDARLDQSKEWLDRQEEYNDMSVEDYISGIDRMLAYTEEYHNRGMISEMEYHETIMDLQDDRIDKVRELADVYMDASDAYKDMQDTYGWSGDSEAAYYTRRLADIEQLYRDGKLSPDDYKEYSREAYLGLYKAAESYYDDSLAQFDDYINDTKEYYGDQREMLQDQWDREDNKEDLDETNRLIEIYKNASTQAGRDKYNDLLETREQLLRDKQLQDLEDKEDAAVKELEEERRRAEKQTNEYLKQMQTTDFNIFRNTTEIRADLLRLPDLVSLTAKQSENGVNIVNVLERILSVVTDMELTSRTVNINGSQRTIYSNTSDIARVIYDTVIAPGSNVLSSI